jgi:hypothetical protein
MGVVVKLREEAGHQGRHERRLRMQQWRIVVRCNKESKMMLRPPERNSTHGWARPHVDGTGLGDVEG